MTKLRQPAARHVWWVNLDKDRLCLVISVDGDLVTVLSGQSKPDPRGSPYIEILPGTNDGKRFGVRQPTYFRAMNMQVIKASLLLEYSGACSSALFVDFSDMLDKYTVALAAAVPTTAEVVALVLPP